MGVALLLAVPTLAVLDVFGPNSHTVAETMPGLVMQVKYPTRFRYKTLNTLDIALKNTSNRPLAPVTVAFDRDYISFFSEVQFTPSAESVTATDYRVKINDIPPGQVRRVSVSLQADHYWLHHGNIRVLVNGSPGMLVPVNTFVFP